MPAPTAEAAGELSVITIEVNPSTSPRSPHVPIEYTERLFEANKKRPHVVHLMRQRKRYITRFMKCFSGT